jgi:hypothetical protein
MAERFKTVAAEIDGIEYEPQLRSKGFLSKLLDSFR